MYERPDHSHKWDFENGFYLTADERRMAKAIAHFELIREASEVPGAIVECGVFRGASLSRFAMYRRLLGQDGNRSIVGFDMFGEFPRSSSEDDTEALDRFLVESGGGDGIARHDLQASLDERGLGALIELVAGDVADTIPKYVAARPEFRISVLNIDTDIYDPAKVILEYLYPLVVPGGIVMLDDYGVFPGETVAAEEYLGAGDGPLRRLPYAATPVYLVKQ